MDMLGVQHAEFYMDSVEVRDAMGVPQYNEKEFIHFPG